MAVHDHRRQADYSQLVRARKACRDCHALVNPSVCEGGPDSDQIGPWSLWQGNLNAHLLVVGQDWGDTAYFSQHEGRDEAEKSRTNKTLIELLKHIGISIPQPSPEDSGQGTLFFTNAVLCLKCGGMQARVQREWFENCGPKFLKPTIDLVRPRVVLSLGARAYSSLVKLYGLQRVRFRGAVETEEGFRLQGGMRLFPMYHCGARVLTTHRRYEQQMRDWEKVRAFLPK